MENINKDRMMFVNVSFFCVSLKKRKKIIKKIAKRNKKMPKTEKRSKTEKVTQKITQKCDVNKRC